MCGLLCVDQPATSLCFSLDSLVDGLSFVASLGLRVVQSIW